MFFEWNDFANQGPFFLENTQEFNKNRTHFNEKGEDFNGNLQPENTQNFIILNELDFSKPSRQFRTN